MKAIRVHTPGGADALRYEDVATPTPKASEALVKIEAIGINFIDIYIRSGTYKTPLPQTLGQVVAGLAVRRGRSPELWALGIVLLYVTATNAVLVSEARHNLPYMPLLAAWGYCWCRWPRSAALESSVRYQQRTRRSWPKKPAPTRSSSIRSRISRLR